MGANTGIISKPRNISVSVSEYNTQTSKIFRFSVSGLNETAWMKNSWNDTAHDIGSQRNKSTRSTHTVEQKFDKIVRTRRISVSMGEVHRQIPANHSGTNQSRGSRDESKVAKEKKEMKGNAWSWIARGARQLQTLQSWVTLRRERQRGTEREREREKRRRKKIISTGSLLADPISGSTVDGRRCLRVDRIAFFVDRVYTVFVLRRIWEASVLARPFPYEFFKHSFLRK